MTNSTDLLHLHRYTGCGSTSELLFLQQRGHAAVPPLSLQCFSHWPRSWQLQAVQKDKSGWSGLGDAVRDIPAALPDPNIWDGSIPLLASLESNTYP